MFRLIGPDGQTYESATPGALGGHRRLKGYGRLDCPSALRWIAKGHYVRHRVFFADEATAVAAGYRPCANCLRRRYAAWKRDPAAFAADWVATQAETWARLRNAAPHIASPEIIMTQVEGSGISPVRPLNDAGITKA